jgi:hypothetical protein
MSRLESFIRRMTAQRLVLDMVCAEVENMQGPILELGLGNGRTYDHIRERLPGRRIIAFDRALGAHPSSVPPEGDLVIGEISVTAAGFSGIGAALVHADIGTGIEALDLKTQEWLPGLAVSLLQPNGIVVSGLPLDHAALLALPLCDGVPADRYFLYRKTG